MKSKLCPGFPLLPFVFQIILFACNKAEDTAIATKINASDKPIDANTFAVKTINCPNAPNYGDSIVFIKPKNGGDFFVEPINNTDIQGTYLSWPEGLNLNRNTGAINLSESETGVRYNIAFIKKETTDTCVSQLIVGGLTYLDAIYVLDQQDTLAIPVFNADPKAPSVCDISDDTDYPDNNSNGNNKCSFDEAIPGQRANDMKLRIRTKSGIINLKRSVADGLFGPIPKNGDKRMVPITYALNDASLKATQKITVQVMYYENASAIPVALQQEVESKRTQMLNYKVVKGKPRPPLLIIAGLSR